MKVKVYRLIEGDLLKESLMNIVKKEKIKAGIVLSSAGCITRGKIRLADGKTQKTIINPHEIVSLTGTLSPDGLHLHISLADYEGKVIGGHLLDETIIGVTCEVAIGVLNETYEFKREYDYSTGYNELVIKNVID